jgi:chromosomal replication initiation ATPase DnaA
MTLLLETVAAETPATAPDNDELFARVKNRLRVTVGEDIASMWFAGLKFLSRSGSVVHLSVCTRFLKRWIENHYKADVLASYQAEDPSVSEVVIDIRNLVLRFSLKKMRPAQVVLAPEPAEEAAASNVQVRLVQEVAENEAVLVAEPKPRAIKVDEIIRFVAKKYEYSRSDFLSSRRDAPIVRARGIGMFLAKVLTNRSLPDIGMRFGNRDHTTVLHAVRNVRWQIGDREGIPIKNVPRYLRDADPDLVLIEEIEIMKREIVLGPPLMIVGETSVGDPASTDSVVLA